MQRAGSGDRATLHRHEVIGEMFDLSHAMTDVDRRHGELFIWALKECQNLSGSTSVEVTPKMALGYY